MPALSEHIPGNASMDEALICITENNTCTSDAVQSLLNCTFGKCNLIHKPFGKMAFNLYFSKSKESLRVYFKGIEKEMLRDEMQDYILNALLMSILFSACSFSISRNSSPILILRFAVCGICSESAKEDSICTID